MKLEPNNEMVESVKADDSFAAVEQNVRFGIDSERKAHWFLRKVLQARAYAKHVEVWAAAELNRARRQEERLMNRFGSELQAWFDMESTKRVGKAKSIQLPAGRIGYRKVAAALSIDDPILLAQWCEHHLPSAVRVTVHAEGEDALALIKAADNLGGSIVVEQRSSSQAIREHVRSTGEVPPGTSVRLERQKFYLS
jgi:hypothetical protein